MVDFLVPVVNKNCYVIAGKNICPQIITPDKTTVDRLLYEVKTSKINFNMFRYGYIVLDYAYRLVDATTPYYNINRATVDFSVKAYYVSYDDEE